VKTKFTDDEVTAIRAAARKVWDKISKEYGEEMTKSRTFILPKTEEIIEAIANDDEIDDVLRSQGHVDLAKLWSRTDPRKMMEILEPEFRLH